MWHVQHKVVSGRRRRREAAQRGARLALAARRVGQLAHHIRARARANASFSRASSKSRPELLSAGRATVIVFVFVFVFVVVVVVGFGLIVRGTRPRCAGARPHARGSWGYRRVTKFHRGRTKTASLASFRTGISRDTLERLGEPLPIGTLIRVQG